MACYVKARRHAKAGVFDIKLQPCKVSKRKQEAPPVKRVYALLDHKEVVLQAFVSFEEACAMCDAAYGESVASFTLEKFVHFLP